MEENVLNLVPDLKACDVIEPKDLCVCVLVRLLE